MSSGLLCRALLGLTIAAIGFGFTPALAASERACNLTMTFGDGNPASEGINPQVLLDLTQWIHDTPVPIFSLLISRHGKVVYDLLTPGIDRDDAHYLMSVTKSVTSALVGAAMDRHLLQNPEQSLLDVLPPAFSRDEGRRRRLAGVTIKDVLAMSALDAQVAPHEDSAAARDRIRRFVASPNRFAFALDQEVLLHPGVDLQYTDVTPIIAAGLVQHATGQSMLDFEGGVVRPNGFSQ